MPSSLMVVFLSHWQTDSRRPFHHSHTMEGQRLGVHQECLYAQLPHGGPPVMLTSDSQCIAAPMLHLQLIHIKPSISATPWKRRG
ncbi:hypothetical protein DUNSADRAFT_13978 [Dunaliella salina]|uniref:Encoded protein n=1 Tax=Dunaliella salina TaxID=3046 RepID=A0ABQ7G8A4_DUNSA|nr:hypothetical protein DUNSADRAFT_13978 [Dunaliella salina]|eukprot:KAF5830831.1 hypothetical protein DUNSADRAFT_13978 [Dunaliella salina]